MPNSTETSLDGSVLHTVEGYKAGLDRIKHRELQGTDKSEFRNKVQNDIAKLHPKRLKLKVSAVIQETVSTKTFRLISLAGALPPFQAGQYINLFVSINGVDTSRPYAISSCPNEDYYELTVKLVDSGFVSRYLLEEVEVGQQLSATGPMGTFYHNPIFHGNDLVFLAGGSGGAPARSMIKSVFKLDLNINFHLIYANSYENDVIFQNEFRQLSEQHRNFELSEVISRPKETYKGLSGYLNSDLISSLITDIEGKTFYICGPTSFNDFCKSQLKKIGISDKRIRIECNGPPKNPSRIENWPEGVSEEDEITVKIKGKGDFKAKVGEPLLNSLERSGYFVENACRSGVCSLCRVKIMKGSVIIPPEMLLRKADKQFGWVHACVAFPTTDIEILY